MRINFQKGFPLNFFTDQTHSHALSHKIVFTGAPRFFLRTVPSAFVPSPSDFFALPGRTLSPTVCSRSCCFCESDGLLIKSLFSGPAPDFA